MNLTIEQTDEAIRNTFYNMKKGVKYVLNDYWFAETNRLRKQYNYSLFKDKQQYKFTRKGDRLFVNNNFVFDFDGKDNLALALSFAFALFFAFADRGVAFADATFAFAFAFALQDNGIEKLNNNTCDGKVVEIDGKKYKLAAV